MFIVTTKFTELIVPARIIINLDYLLLLSGMLVIVLIFNSLTYYYIIQYRGRGGLKNNLKTVIYTYTENYIFVKY